jgi:hypothetical protein
VTLETARELSSQKQCCSRLACKAQPLQAFIEGGHLVLRKVEKPVRSGWEAAAAEIAARGEDALVLGEFGNAEDEKLVW